MGARLKAVKDQVIVITGASSGIGLATAEMAAARGARVMLASRNAEALEQAVGRIRARGGQASWCVADVAVPEQVVAVADRAAEEFGRIDTWINNAGISIYGRLVDTPLDDKRRLFDVNFWGVVHGCRAAVPHLRHYGGAIVNMGSITSDVALPLQGIYAASKQAVKGYTDALRLELEEEGAPIAVTLVKPSAIGTPFTEHARSYMAEEPALPPPIYVPEVVARTILRCAEHPIREITVGGAGRAMTLLKAVAPRLNDLFMERTMFAGQKANEPAHDRDSLYEPGDDGRTRGPYNGHAPLQRSAYTRAMLSDAARVLPLVAAAAAVAVAISQPPPRDEPPVTRT